MANYFTGDPNCISAWRFEAGAMLTDEMGKNDLTWFGVDYKPVEDTTIYKESDCSAKWNDGIEEPYTIADGDLSADFPLKNGGSATFSWVAWIYPTVGSHDQYLIGKMDYTGYDSALLVSYGLPSWAFLASGNETDTGLAVETDTWHHVAVTYDGGTDQLTIRVYHESTGLTDSYQTTLTGGDVVVAGSQPWTIGSPFSLETVRIDELAVFDDVLTADEIDEIRAGTFGGGGGGGVEQTTGDGGGISTFFLGCPF